MGTMRVVVVVALAVCAIGGVEALQRPDKPNVLYLVVDDLRPELGAYNQSHMSTPNLDALAARSMVFERAYVQQAVCGASRNSFMTGRYPDATRSYNFIDHFREIGVGDKWTAMPQLFKREGYLSGGAGKLYHPNLPPDFDGSNSWSEEALPWVDPTNYTCHGPMQKAHRLEWCVGEFHGDGIGTRVGLQFIDKAVAKGKPFFAGIGLHKPHLPFVASQEQFDQYPLESIQLPQHPVAPQGMPDAAWVDTGDSASPWTPMDQNDTLHARRAYYAAVTHTDTKVGEILSALEEKGLANSTIILFHADHGWSLGEHCEWRKFTNFEIDTRVPFMVHVPWLADSQGQHTTALTELVDVFPTLAELAGLQMPTNETFDGQSLVPILQGSQPSVRQYAFSQFPRRPHNISVPWQRNQIGQVPRTNFTIMGYSLRSDKFRYTEWVGWDGASLKPVWTKWFGNELYDHSSEPPTGADFNSYENVNVVNDPQHKELVATLSTALRAHFNSDDAAAAPLLKP